MSASSLRADIGEAVTEELNAASAAGEFPDAPGFAAVRAILPEYELEELNDLIVTVVARGYEEALESRSSSLVRVTVDVGVMQRVADATPEQVDPLDALVEGIIGFLRGRPLAAFPDASWLRTSNPSLHNDAFLTETRVFQSVITLEYEIRVNRAR
jgi:hypothetical protein